MSEVEHKHVTLHPAQRAETVSRVWLQIIEERRRQELKFPGRTCASRDVTPLVKLRILMEEVGEVAEALDEGDANTVRELRAELTQVAAVAFAWLESLEAQP